MDQRFFYEQTALANRKSSEALTIEQFVALAPYVDGPSPDTFYDGTLIQINVASPILAGSGSVTVEILGPMWDRVFQLKFGGVTNFTHTSPNHFSGIDLREVKLSPASDGSRECTFVCLTYGEEITLTFGSASVVRYMLESPLDRTSGNG